MRRVPGTMAIMLLTTPAISGRSRRFGLSEKDEAGLRKLLQGTRADEYLKGLQTVGWYHWKYRLFELTRNHINLHDRYFPEPWQVAMVFMRGKTEPGVGSVADSGALGRVPRVINLLRDKVLLSNVDEPELARSRPLGGPTLHPVLVGARRA